MSILNSNSTVARIYYSLSTHQTPTLIPTIVFKNVDTYTNVNAYDFSLFRYSIFVQTAYNNNTSIPTNSANISNFSRCFIGQLQIYPVAFNGCLDTHPFSITNEIGGNTNYQIPSNLNYASNGRPFYSNNESKFFFNFNKFTQEPNDIDIKIIYSIQIELLNPGKIPKTSITTEHFDINLT